MRSSRPSGPAGSTTDLAVGEGAVWVGNGRGDAGPVGSSIRPASPVSIGGDDHRDRHRGSAQLCPAGAVDSGEYRTLGVSQLAVGAGAVWAINPDLSVSRIDADTGARIAIIPVEAGGAIAAGEGVWAIAAEAPHVLRIDPRTNKVVQRIELEADSLTGLAVGGGSVWATDLETGSLWRIDPGPDPITRTIDVGSGSLRSPSAGARSGSRTSSAMRSCASTRGQTR